MCVCVLYFYMVMQQHNTTMATMMWKGIINKCCNSNKNNNSGSSNSSSIKNNIIIILIDIININNNNKPLSYSIVLILYYRKHSLTLHSTIPYISIFKTKQRNEETKQLDLTQRRKIKDKHERSSCSMNKMLATLSMTSKQSCLGFVF